VAECQLERIGSPYSRQHLALKSSLLRSGLQAERPRLVKLKNTVAQSLNAARLIGVLYSFVNTQLQALTRDAAFWKSSASWGGPGLNLRAESPVM
jgi:hypothetical protein